MNNQGLFKKWWWLICAILYMPFVVFLYVGKKANNRLWIIFGTIYLLLFAVIIALNNLYKNESWCESLAIVYCFIGIVHSYLSWSKYREEFLQQEDDEIEANNVVAGHQNNSPIKNHIKIVPFLKYDIAELQRANVNKTVVNIPDGAIGFLGVIAKMCYYFLFLVFIGLGLAFLPNGGEDSVFSLIIICVTILLFFFGIKYRKYKPEKSFWKYRKTNEQMKKRYTIVGFATILFFVACFFFVGFDWRLIAGIIGAAYGLYYTSKSYEVHGDVDFSVNNEVSELLGFDIDEKIQASYQDDDSNRIILMTNRKIYYVYERKKQRNLVVKKLEELSKLGTYREFFSQDAFCLYLVFSDKTKMAVQMNLGDKLTSNPDLFFKKFLMTLDDYLLGRNLERAVSRRRISVGSEEKEEVTETVPKGRSIDISSTVINMMKDAIPVTENRKIEL